MGVLGTATAYADDGDVAFGGGDTFSLGATSTQTGDSGFANSAGGGSSDGEGGVSGSSGVTPYALPPDSGLDLNALLAAVPYRPLPVVDGYIYLPAIAKEYKDKAAIPGFANPIGSWSGTYVDAVDHSTRPFTANIRQEGTVTLNDGRVTYSGTWRLETGGIVVLSFTVGILHASWAFTIDGDKGTGTGHVTTNPNEAGTPFDFQFTRQRSQA